MGSFSLCLFEVFTAELSRVCRPFHPPIAMGSRLLRAAASPGQEAPRGGAGVSLQMDSHYLSLLERAGGVQRDRLPGGLGQTQLAAGGSNESGRGVVRNVCGKTVEEDVNFLAGLSKKSTFLLDSAPQKSVNASHPASRLTTHDSGSVWLAKPSP